MANRSNEERLREIVDTPLSLAPTVCNYIDAWYFAAELLAARETIRSNDRLLPSLIAAREEIRSKNRLLPSLIAEGFAMERERAEKAEAEVYRLRSRVGWLDHLDTAEGRAMHATEAVRVENEQLRADLREAMKLLNAASPNMGDAEWDEWGSKANKLLFKDNNNT